MQLALWLGPAMSLQATAGVQEVPVRLRCCPLFLQHSKVHWKPQTGPGAHVQLAAESERADYFYYDVIHPAGVPWKRLSWRIASPAPAFCAFW